ncbi:hypothetical protein HDU98_009542 [Podochytrium sp. JEL0797]|nr:hypothetical protein HDU98_009542 [Podochytrium sp. JEL0797]
MSEEVAYVRPSSAGEALWKALPQSPASPDQRPNSVAAIPMAKSPSIARMQSADRRMSMIDGFKRMSNTISDRMSTVCEGLYKHGFADGLFSDIVVHVLGQAYNLHRLALINNKYFALRMLEIHGDAPSNGKLELSIDMQDPNVNHDALRVVFARMYGYFEDRVTTENLESILAAAYFFHDADLCEMCADFIKTIKYTPTNALQYITYSSTFDYGETSLLLLRHVLIYLCREGFSDKELAQNTFPHLTFAWFARILQSDAFFIPSEFNRFNFITEILQRKFTADKFTELKNTVQGMTSHVLALGRLPVSPPASPRAEPQELHVSPAEQTANNQKVVFLGNVAQVSASSLPSGEGDSESIDAAINLLAKGLLYAHVPLGLYNQIRESRLLPSFVHDRHFRIHHDMIRLVETTPKGIQKLGVSYHYNQKNVVIREGEPQGFFELVMAPVYAHDLLEMPPFRFGVEFGGLEQVALVVPVPGGKPPVVPGNALLKVLKGAVGESLVSKGVAYAGGLWSVRIEKGLEDGVNQLEVGLVRKVGNKESTVCVDARVEAKFWCRIVAYVCVNNQVTEAYEFESTGVNFLNQASRVGEPSREIFKELFVAGGKEPNQTSVRFSVLLGVL